eukprot:CAMPEP_0175061354 /NCGR_PEP_ID=MMETSP0052_2-20121109/13535_1 /TAXON_ID=51329 ORGANISM="Polytomella parva, Strain SAG 63-3" /NCGR_SAMPLE_ID=MMETSP0052_2 /ASSEMBLY_ACC=CAM_ASM_000194 /LENGTH=82 /DNA_ID=CAMNT_0016327193 /DNA_START=140 /DNA_END=384 /DNA_ORIENTATION=+
MRPIAVAVFIGACFRMTTAAAASNSSSGSTSTNTSTSIIACIRGDIGGDIRVSACTHRHSAGDENGSSSSHRSSSSSSSSSS